MVEIGSRSKGIWNKKSIKSGRGVAGVALKGHGHIQSRYTDRFKYSMVEKLTYSSDTLKFESLNYMYQNSTGSILYINSIGFEDQRPILPLHIIFSRHHHHWLCVSNGRESVLVSLLPWQPTPITTTTTTTTTTKLCWHQHKRLLLVWGWREQCDVIKLWWRNWARKI